MQTLHSTKQIFATPKKNVFSMFSNYLAERKLLKHNRAQARVAEMRNELKKDNKALHANFIKQGGTEKNWIAAGKALRK